MYINSVNSSFECQKGRNNARNFGFGAIMKNNIAKVLKTADDGIKDKFVCVVSGPSGVGKDSVLNGFNEKYGFFSRVVTCTTRKPRPGEVNGVNYHFLSPEEFKKGVENDEFLEYVNVYADTFYGTRRKDVDEALSAGKNVVMALDVDGAMAIKDKRLNSLLLFIEPPSLEELGRRLVSRGTETVAAIKERLGKASYELGFKDNYDVIIRNDNLPESIEEVAEVFKVKG